VILFSTYGSGAGKKRCLDYLEKIVKDKGAKSVRRCYIPQARLKDKEFVLSSIRQAADVFLL